MKNARSILAWVVMAAAGETVAAQIFRPPSGVSSETGLIPNRALRTDGAGRVATVFGALTDCVRVDGSAAACGTGGGSGGGMALISGELPSGSINGSNVTFGLSQTPTASTENVFLNGLRLVSGIDYSISGATITMAFPPVAGSSLRVTYAVGSAGGGGGGGGGGGESPLTFTAPLVRTVNTISLPAAASGVSGYLSASDWALFSGKAAVAGCPANQVAIATLAGGISCVSLTASYLPAAVVLTSGSYADPAWLTSLDWSKITSKPSTFAPSAHSHAAADVTSGTFADARIAASNVTQHQGALSIGWAQLTSVPSTFSPSAHTHPASDIASGQVALARGGTGADLSATGGAGQFLRQTTAGGAVTVGAIAASDVPTLNQNTTGNAGTATALAADGTDCSSGQAARGVDAAGNATGCFTPSGGGVDTVLANYFGSGEDGDVTCSGASTLSKDMFYNNLTVQSGCAITAHQYRVFVKGTLDLTAAPAGWLIVNGANGGNASGATAGTVGTGGTSNLTSGVTIGSRLAGTAGAAGTTGTGAQAGTSLTLAGTNGGSSGSGGAGGSGGSGAGGAARTLPVVVPRPVASFQPQLMTMHGTGLGYMQGGGGGAGGSSGAGDGTNTGGGGGGGPSGGGVIWLSANTIHRGAGTANNGIQAMGGNGGVGGSRVTGNCGGGGGAGGAGGGWVLVYYWQLTGTTAVNHIEVDGGSGGNGGNAAGTGVPGNGGNGGACGRVTLINLQTATSSTTGGGAGSAASGQTGGAGCLLSVSL